MEQQYSKPSQDELKQTLSDIQYRVTQLAHTESAYSGKYDKFYDKGNYSCIICDLLLFYSDQKYDSGCGWPAFNQGLEDNIEERLDKKSGGIPKIEVVCKRCSAHLGHKFKARNSSTGIRYCINSASIQFNPQKQEEK